MDFMVCLVIEKFSCYSREILVLLFPVVTVLNKLFCFLSFLFLKKQKDHILTLKLLIGKGTAACCSGIESTNILIFPEKVLIAVKELGQRCPLKV